LRRPIQPHRRFAHAPALVGIVIFSGLMNL
jgi:hypothetical protein